MQFPRELLMQIRTNDPLNRIMSESRRRILVVGAIPNGCRALTQVTELRVRTPMK